jgi:hypothetical protein
MARKSSAPDASTGRAHCTYDSDASRLVYIFDSQRGIIAFQEASGWPDPLDVSRWSLDTIGTTADMYALIEPKGLLAPAGR